MTIKELSKLFYLNKEIIILSKELLEITEIGATVLDGMPKGSSTTSKVEMITVKKEELRKEIVDAQLEYIDKRVRIETYINSIDDPKIRLIARLRFVEFKSWYDIADEITPYGKELVDPTAPLNMMKRYLKKTSKTNKMSDKSVSHVII